MSKTRPAEVRTHAVSPELMHANGSVGHDILPSHEECLEVLFHVRLGECLIEF
jgi:hypothetical protein